MNEQEMVEWVDWIDDLEERSGPCVYVVLGDDVPTSQEASVANLELQRRGRKSSVLNVASFDISMDCDNA